MSELVTQSELAKHFGLSRGYVSKLVKRGLLDGCRKDSKLVRACLPGSLLTALVL